MKKRIVSMILAVCVIGTALAGCGNSAATEQKEGSGETTEMNTQADSTGAQSDSASDGETASGSVTDVNEDGTVNNPENVKIDEGKLVFWSLFSGGDGTFMDQIISDYNAGSPKMGVQSIMLVWDDYYTKLQTAVAAGKGPDIGISHVSKLPELVNEGSVIALNDYLDQLDVDLSSLFSQNSLDSVTFDGDIYAIPLDTHAEIMYFNKDILMEAGVELNENGQLDIGSTDDFYAVLDKIKAVIPEGSSALSLTNSGDDPYRLWWASYYQMGGKALVSDDGSQVTMDKEIAVKAAEFVKSLYDKGYILEGIDDHQAFFQSGKAGLLFAGTWATGALESTENLNFGAQTFPQLFDSDACWADSHTLIIPFSKDRTEDETLAAVEFVLAASSEGGVTWAKSGQIPANLKVLESDDYLKMPYRSDYKSALDKAVMPTKNPNFYGMKAGMIDSLNAYWTGQTDAQGAIDNLFGELESNLE